MKIYLSKIKQVILTVILSLLSFYPSFAQFESTKIKDGTISSGPEKAKPGAIFELESNIKGMLITRMTTAQRNAIPVASLSDGLLIFNTTTGCFDYWNTIQNVWLSMCGTPPPAVFDLSAAQCSAIVVNGTYKQGDALTQANFLTVPVTVTQPGTYTISATTTNGYYFETSGTFPAANSYDLILKATGRPNSGYDVGNPGDPVKITLNGMVNSCQPNIFVERANVDFSMNCGTITVQGSYYVGLDLTASNKLIVPTNVTNIGFWSMSTNTLNGYSFNGTGTFTTTGLQTVELIGTGKPTASGTNSFNVTSNAATSSSCSGIPVVVAPIAYTIDCSTAVQNGTYLQALPFTETNTITLPINVTATGQTTISTNTVNGISFSTGPITLTSLGAQNVVLKGVGTPLSPGTTTLTVTGSPGAAATCSINIIINPQPVAYTMTCASITTNGSYAPGVDMVASNTMTVPVNVTFVGDYTISTNTVNGISFSATGTFATTGTQNVVLTAAGTPTGGGTFSYTISSNSASSSATCSKSITFVFRTMNVLGLGESIYQPGSSSTTYSARAILTSATNFGPSGTVQIQSFNIVNGGYNTGTSLRNLINTNNIDIIYLGYNYDTTDPTTMAVFSNFVNNKKGVLIYASERYSVKNVIDAVCGSNVTTNTTNSSYVYNLISAADPVLIGPFGDLTGKLLGGDGANSIFLSGTMPANTTAIATQGTNTFMLKHNTLGFVFLGDGGFVAGYSGDTNTGAYPCSMSGTGLPLSKNYSGGTIYNSAMYGNLFAWGIKYAQANTVVSYVIP